MPYHLPPWKLPGSNGATPQRPARLEDRSPSGLREQSTEHSRMMALAYEAEADRIPGPFMLPSGIRGDPRDPKVKPGEYEDRGDYSNTENPLAVHKHITISRDQTEASSFKSDQLLVLQQGLRQSKGSAPVAPNYLPDYPPDLGGMARSVQGTNPQMTRSFGNSNVLIGHGLSRPATAGSDSSKENEIPLVDLAGDSMTPIIFPQGSISEHRENKMLSNSIRISHLEAEIQNLRTLQNSLKSTTWLILHKLQDEDAIFLEEPSWTIGQGSQPRLRGNSPVADEITYLRQRSDVAFVIYKKYEHDYQSKAIEKAKAEGNPLPDPVPVMEAIRLLSEEMISAVDVFTSAQEAFKVDFPMWNSRAPIVSPFLFWYRYRSPEALDTIPEPHKSQMHLLTQWIDLNYDQVYTKADSQFARGFVSRSTIPFFVRPGDVLVSKNDGDIQGYVAETWAISEPVDEGSKVPRKWTVRAWSYGYDGQFYRYPAVLEVHLKCGENDEDVDIAVLDILPLRFANDEIRAKLHRRSRIMWACRYRKLIAYKGEFDGELSGEGERYMIDCKTYKQLHPSGLSMRNGRKEMNTTVMKSDEPPCGPESLTFPKTIVGYNLRQKKWYLKVDLFQDVVWNTEAFKHLVIDEETKDLVQALITTKLENEQGTDLIQGKGNGLIILLHGGPGTGKTFTAESVAEIARKPLYRVTCGDIGTTPEKVEKYLESVLHLGKIWGCVVLLDEADVFLEQRTLTDLERNALVSVFLRVLEYYEGILILTSNRVGTFDEAFKSRIQLSLHYEALSKSQRRMIWSNFLDRLSTPYLENKTIEPITQRKRKIEEVKNVDFEDIRSHLAELAEHEMNGRQIRNAITTARQLAKFKKEDMAYRHLDHVIKTSRKFDRYLEKIRDDITDEQVAREDRIR